jgi:hypothetical protein
MNGSDANSEQLVHLLLQSLSGQLSQLQLRHLLPLGRALLTPMSFQQQQQQQLASQPQMAPGHKPCLLQDTPQLAAEFIEQVRLAPELEGCAFMGVDGHFMTQWCKC